MKVTAMFYGIQIQSSIINSSHIVKTCSSLTLPWKLLFNNKKL